MGDFTCSITSIFMAYTSEHKGGANRETRSGLNEGA